MLWQSWCEKALRFVRSSRRASMSLAESRSLAAAAAAAESGSGEADEPLRALTEALPPRRRLKMDGSDAERDVALHGGARLDDCDDGMPPELLFFFFLN